VCVGVCGFRISSFDPVDCHRTSYEHYSTGVQPNSAHLSIVSNKNPVAARAMRGGRATSATYVHFLK